ncbi:hypothetical protein KEM60_01449 [Austwickia sp. TVS 96-490-7B]|uniref:hypothetical protein n=1 Tax=Austwickia sp. TVS 96-490-7B TaxID=2830843 RepID=UPI001C59ACC1|nr:hypothetical protein [Austwickia sp. TVS 96-490-7B]MBW3085252.1 hypothetical protein [Austwickia sp. TVS 96-490-7B]
MSLRRGIRSRKFLVTGLAIGLISTAVAAGATGDVPTGMSRGAPTTTPRAAPAPPITRPMAPAPVAIAQLPPVTPRPIWGEPASREQREATVAAVRAYLTAADAVYTRGSAVGDAEKRVATGAALGEIAAATEELTSQKRHQSGSVTMASASAYLQPEEDRVLVVTCLDSSAVTLTEDDDTGRNRRVRTASRAGTRTALHEYTLEKAGDHWVVLLHSLPDDMSCAR